MIINTENGQSWHSKEYEWLTGSVTVAGTDATTSLAAQSGFTTLFTKLPLAHRVKITATGTCYVRLNASTNDKITVDATTPFSSDFLQVKAIYISTNGAGVAVTVQLT